MKKSATHQYYDTRAKWWAATKTDSFYQEEPFRKLRGLLKEGDAVLDIGCAGGIHVPLFLGIGRDLVYRGIDISEEMVGIAASRYPQLPFAVTDLMSYVPEKKVHAIWAAAVLMHVPAADAGTMFSHLEAITRSGGYAYITLPSRRPTPKSDTDKRHFTLYSKKKIESIAKERGWEILWFKSMLGSSGKLTWNGFIVKFPKKNNKT